MHTLPILYSFRRCPYAMRARYALALKGMQCELREVHLKNKPQALLDASPKGTVPVLVLPDTLIEESLDIIAYAFDEEVDSPLITANDTVFTKALHRYKYHDRYPEQSQADYRDECDSLFLSGIEKKLNNNVFLNGDNMTAEDIALFPHIRQFSLVDADWFNASGYVNISRWLNQFFTSQTYETIMAKHTPWVQGDEAVFLL